MNLLSTLLAIGALLVQDAAENTSGGRLLDEQAAFDVLHYDLDLAVDPTRRSIEGTLGMRARLLRTAREIALHLDPALEVRAVRAGGDEVARVGHRHEDGIVWIDVESLEAPAGSEIRVEVDYGGVPRVAENPPWDGGFTWSEADGEPWIATSCQGEGADLWWPCKDHPSDKPESMSLAFTVPEGLVVATNGRRIDEETADGLTTSRWQVSTPIANYAVAFNAGPFVELVRTMERPGGEDLPIHFWVLRTHVEEGEAFLDEIVDHMRFFEDVCGPYPFRADKYGVVETPHLGMEHQTIIAYGNRFRGDRDFDYDWLHHHELAHEWWANLVTARDWADFWIHEGIGTYMQPLYLERKFGREAYEKKMGIDLLRVLNNAPVAPRPPRTTDSIYFSEAGDDAPGGDIYFKGSWVCHSLRWLLGDETFFRVLRRWAYPDPALEATTDGSAVRFTDTAELIEIAEEVSGEDLEWFFDVYVRRAPLPVLEHEVADGVLTMRWRAPDDLPFPMPVEVSFDGVTRRVEMPEGRISFEVGDAEVEVDPSRRVLRDFR